MVFSEAATDASTKTRAFPDPGSRSSELYQRALRCLPGGNSRHTVYFPPYPLYAVRAAGSRVWDADGVERIDFINNYSSLIHGHSHPEIVDAIVRQAGTLLSIAMPTEREIELAELLTARFPAVEQVRFCNSGTEAVLNAIKVARAFTGRRKIAKIEGAYHGSAETAQVSTLPSPKLWGPADAPASVPGTGNSSAIADDVVVLPMNDVEAGRRILRAQGADLAGVLIDPLVKNLGFMPASPAFLTMLREEMDACGGLLIFDEVYSVRLGFNGAHATTMVRPDLVALGKIIGGGLPVGAVGGLERIMTAVFDPRNGALLAHGGTFNANPLTMSAGLAAMRLFDEPAFDRLSQLGERLRSGLREALRIADVPGKVQGATSMVYLSQIAAPVETYRDFAKALAASKDAREKSEKVFRHLLNNGVLVGNPGYFVLSTANTEAEVDHAIEQTLKALRTL